MFTQPEIEHHSVRFLPGREGFAGLSTADHVRLGRINPEPEGWVPYCEDEHTGHLICATGLDATAIAARGLHYAQLRPATKKIAVVPSELVPVSVQARTKRVYLFSPGRCGSTLLCQVLRAAGVPALAEPGFYLSFLQRARGTTEAQRSGLRTTLAKLEYLLLKPFDDADTVIIKPHPYCSADLDLWLGGERGQPRPLTIALLRRIIPWSHSWYTFNQTDAVQDVALYIRYLEQLAILKATTNCLLVTYEELVKNPAQVVKHIGQHLDIPVDISKTTTALQIDAHAGDKLWEGKAGPSDGTRETLVNTVWQIQRPDALIERLGISHLTD
jgi:hypothetical protein